MCALNDVSLLLIILLNFHVFAIQFWVKHCSHISIFHTAKILAISIVWQTLLCLSPSIKQSIFFHKFPIIFLFFYLIFWFHSCHCIPQRCVSISMEIFLSLLPIWGIDDIIMFSNQSIVPDSFETTIDRYLQYRYDCVLPTNIQSNYDNRRIEQDNELCWAKKQAERCK